MPTSRLGVPGVIVAIALTIAACGGGPADNVLTDGPGGASAAPTDDGTGSEGSVLHPTIANLPLLDPHQIPFPGSVFPDPWETVAQDVVYTQNVRQVAEFYFTALPSAGFEIYADEGSWVATSDITDVAQARIAFRNPAGQLGHLSLGQRQDGGVNMLINLQQKQP